MGLGSGIRKKPILDPGVKKAQDPVSRIRGPQHWINAIWAPDEQAKLVLNIESYTHRYSIT